MDILQDMLDKPHPLNKGDFLLRDTSPMQSKVLDMFRLTDEFRQIYGSYFWTTIPKALPFGKQLRRFKSSAAWTRLTCGNTES